MIELALKLLLVPLLLALVTLTARRFGPRVAGWLGSLPVVAGPVLLIVTLEQGAVFGARASEFALAGILPTALFCVIYARVCTRQPWTWTMLASVGGWILAVAVLMTLPDGLLLALGLAVGALLLAPGLLPPLPSAAQAPRPHRLDLPARMLMGALLVVISGWLAARFGPRLAGYAALFPVITSVAAGCTHALDGSAATLRFLSGLTRGLWSVGVFCLVLSLLLPLTGIALAFTLASLLTLVAHGLLRPAVDVPTSRRCEKIRSGPACRKTPGEEDAP